jgi:hypothetical protein
MTPNEKTTKLLMIVPVSLKDKLQKEAKDNNIGVSELCRFILGNVHVSQVRRSAEFMLSKQGELFVDAKVDASGVFRGGEMLRDIDASAKRAKMKRAKVKDKK